MEQLEGEVSLLKNANRLLAKDKSSIERKVLQDNQYHRLENIEISGIPKNVIDYELIDTVIGIAADIEVELAPADISACHRLGKGDKSRGDVIVRFVNRQAADHMFANAKKLKGLDLSDLLGPNHPHVYVNANLSPELKASSRVSERRDAEFTSKRRIAERKRSCSPTKIWSRSWLVNHSRMFSKVPLGYNRYRFRLARFTFENI